MKIGIIGTGNVGGALATGLAAVGHEVVVGSRDPETNEVDGVEAMTQRAAAEYGDVVILALPAGVVADVAADLQDALVEKPVLDTANEYPNAGSERSLATRVADAVPDAHVVKAFNTIGANRMTDPIVDGEAATMFLAGDSAEAVDTARTLAADLGFEPVVAGGLGAASHLEHLARFWIHLSGQHSRDIAFRLLREEQPNE
ncbi:NADP oxidoreductase [Halorubrum sp. CBA1125]|uniref:NADPH-dependent F420 reductase n=1 Tax=Halorubrum sp. CBA1125 TaxID=2668072 RepID=UPI0012E78E03|nr:NAD(P)-binding domain-containing protein [Halorubrum sp. CBA1125]MUW14821.1 NADP oxidoreductase [Halorubrum sp. CBA1125]